MRRSLAALICLAACAFAQQATPPQPPAKTLSVQWEELTAPEFVQAIRSAQGTCVLPFGIMEKHGPHLPLGTDLINVRHMSIGAARLEYAVVFPPYYFGQIFEGKHQPGTVSYSLPLQLQMLQETTDEMSRNGCKKILIMNGHGGNNNLLPLYAQAQLASRKDYVVYTYNAYLPPQPGRPALKSSFDLHGGEVETSKMLVSAPALVKMETVPSESGADQNRQANLPQGVYTGIWWYAKFPNHYAGDASVANKELGEFDSNAAIQAIAAALKAIKADTVSPALQKQFYDQAEKPLETKQNQ